MAYVEKAALLRQIQNMTGNEARDALYTIAIHVTPTQSTVLNALRHAMSNPTSTLPPWVQDVLRKNSQAALMPGPPSTPQGGTGCTTLGSSIKKVRPTVKKHAKKMPEMDDSSSEHKETDRSESDNDSQDSGESESEQEETSSRNKNSKAKRTFMKDAQSTTDNEDESHSNNEITKTLHKTSKKRPNRKVKVLPSIENSASDVEPQSKKIKDHKKFTAGSKKHRKVDEAASEPAKQTKSAKRHKKPAKKDPENNTSGKKKRPRDVEDDGELLEKATKKARVKNVQGQVEEHPQTDDPQPLTATSKAVVQLPVRPRSMSTASHVSRVSVPNSSLPVASVSNGRVTQRGPDIKQESDDELQMFMEPTTPFKKVPFGIKVEGPSSVQQKSVHAATGLAQVNLARRLFQGSQQAQATEPSATPVPLGRSPFGRPPSQAQQRTPISQRPNRAQQVPTSVTDKDKEREFRCTACSTWFRYRENREGACRKYHPGMFYELRNEVSVQPC